MAGACAAFISLSYALCLDPANALQGLPTTQQIQELIGGQQAGTTNGGGTTAPTTTILEPNATPNPQLPTSRLEQIMSSRAGVKLKQFGYDQLGVGRAVNMPQLGAVEDSYVLGPGDEFVITLRGQENSEYRVQVDRDGMVTLPRLASIPASGRTLGAFRADMGHAIHRAYVSTEGYVTMGRLRQISVLVSGEVNSPGVRTLTGLSTALDAVLVSGGVKKGGSLRNVIIVRGGRRIPVDLYSVLTGQGEGSRVTLTSGDTVVVPPLGPTAAIAGWVRRPGIYEISKGRSSISVSDILSLAGGLEVRGKYRLSILRVGSDGRNQMTPVEGQSGIVGDSEILFAQPGASQTVNNATLSGGTALAGQYTTKNTKLSAILKSPGALGDNPYTLFGVISRRDPVTLMRTLVAFTPVAILRGVSDMDVQSDDVVRVISSKEAQFLFTAMQQYDNARHSSESALRNPTGSNPYAAAQAAIAQGNQGVAQRQALTDVINGEFDQDKRAADQILKDPSQPDNGEPTTQQGQTQSQTQLIPGQLVPSGGGISQGMVMGNPYSSPGNPYSSSGVGMAGGNPYQMQQGSIMVPAQGAVSQLPSAQARPLPPNMEDVPAAPGDIPSNREITRLSQLAGQLHVDPLILVNFLQDHFVNIDGAVRGPGLYLVGPDADLQSLLVAAGGVRQWADKSSVELISTQVDPASGVSRTNRRTLSLTDVAGTGFIVSPHDEVRVKDVFTDVGLGSVTVQGEVRQNGTYQIVRGEHLSDLMMRAGGLTDSAYPYGTVFLRRSAAEKEQEAFRREASEINNQLLVAMSRRDSNSKLSPDAFLAIQGYIKDLKEQTALGRVTVIADPAVLAANPAADPLLEPGDVVYVPPRPYAVSVVGEFLQPGSIAFRPGMSASDYIAQAGGYSQYADKSETILVLPDGSARRVESSWFDFGGESVPPGSMIFAARDISGIDLHQIILDTTTIFSQLAVTAASLAVLSKQ